MFIETLPGKSSSRYGPHCHSRPARDLVRRSPHVGYFILGPIRAGEHGHSLDGTQPQRHGNNIDLGGNRSAFAHLKSEGEQVPYKEIGLVEDTQGHACEVRWDAETGIVQVSVYRFPKGGAPHWEWLIVGIAKSAGTAIMTAQNWVRGE